MKKAPRRYKNGGTPGDPIKKRPNVPNPDYPTDAEQMAAKGLINPTTAAIYKKENENKRLFSTTTPEYNTSLAEAGTGVGTGRSIETLGANMRKITNPDGSVTYVDAAGNPITPLSRANGGEIKKMKKAPRKNMGGKIC